MPMIHDAGEIISKHMQRHLAGDPRQCLHEEVGSPHPSLDRAEGMPGKLTSSKVQESGYLMAPHIMRYITRPKRTLLRLSWYTAQVAAWASRLSNSRGPWV
jgi:hypothetical protein